MPSPAVLYIDDLPHLLKLRAATLESHGYSVKTASNTHTASKVLEETSVTAVLLESKPEGIDRGRGGMPYQATISQPADYPGFGQRGNAGADPMAVDEYVMKSELPDGLVEVLQRKRAAA